MSGFLLLVTGRALLMRPKGRNASRDGLIEISWVVIAYSLLFPCIFNLGKLLMPFCARMLRYQLGARFYINFPPLPINLSLLEFTNYFIVLLCNTRMFSLELPL